MALPESILEMWRRKDIKMVELSIAFYNHIKELEDKKERH